MNRLQTKRKGFWTLRYTLLNAAYFAAFCTVHALAAVYLLDNGFTNTVYYVDDGVSGTTWERDGFKAMDV